MAPDPLYVTRILDIRVEPAKDEYIPGEGVVLAGTLEVHDFWTCHWGTAPGEGILVYGDSVELLTSGRTGANGVFRIPINLPSDPKTYAYRTHFPGRDWVAARDPCWSDTLLVKVAGAPPVEFICPYCGAVFYTPEALEAHIAICSERPPIIPPELGKYLLYGSAGLFVAGLVWMVVRS